MPTLGVSVSTWYVRGQHWEYLSTPGMLEANTGSLCLHLVCQRPELGVCLHLVCQRPALGVSVYTWYVRGQHRESLSTPGMLDASTESICLHLVCQRPTLGVSVYTWYVRGQHWESLSTPGMLDANTGSLCLHLAC